jgi:hypothetical protein
VKSKQQAHLREPYPAALILPMFSSLTIGYNVLGYTEITEYYLHVLYSGLTFYYL